MHLGLHIAMHNVPRVEERNSRKNLFGEHVRLRLGQMMLLSYVRAQLATLFAWLLSRSRVSAATLPLTPRCSITNA
jgi:hypothetical protein